MPLADPTVYASASIIPNKKRKQFFFEKKNQKDLVEPGGT
jgi:hypothetical protein